jgi:type I restriction enzyme M protein
MRKSELSSAIKSARNIMRKDAGLSTDVDRIPQLSWILFLKCFDDLEQRRMLLEGKYRDVIEEPYRWRDWAADEDRGRSGASWPTRVSTAMPLPTVPISG